MHSDSLATNASNIPMASSSNHKDFPKKKRVIWFSVFFFFFCLALVFFFFSSFRVHRWFCKIRFSFLCVHVHAIGFWEFGLLLVSLLIL